MDENWPTEENNEGIRRTNIALLSEALNLLYETHICNRDSADKRGEAIRAITDILHNHGDVDNAVQAESKPWSQRMRESDVWPEEFKESLGIKKK